MVDAGRRRSMSTFIVESSLAVEPTQESVIIDEVEDATTRQSRGEGAEHLEAGDTAAALSKEIGDVKLAPEADQEPEMCCICQQGLLEDLVSFCACGHVLHELCAAQYVSSKLKSGECRAEASVPCPVCRAVPSRKPTLYTKLFLDVSRYSSRTSADEILRRAFDEKEKALKLLQDEKGTWETKMTAAKRREDHLLGQLDCFRESHIKTAADKRNLNETLEETRERLDRAERELATSKAEMERLHRLHGEMSVDLDNERGEHARARKQLEELTRLRTALNTQSSKLSVLEKESKRLEGDNRRLKDQNSQLIRLKRQRGEGLDDGYDQSNETTLRKENLPAMPGGVNCPEKNDLFAKFRPAISFTSLPSLNGNGLRTLGDAKTLNALTHVPPAPKRQAKLPNMFKEASRVLRDG
jgi:hypothetical protein